MSGLSGQAEITVTKADGRQFKQVIKNDIATGVYTQLTDQMRNSNNNYAGYIPDRLKITLNGGATYEELFPDSTPSVAHSDTFAYVEYSLAEPVVGSEFTGTIGGYVSQVELLDDSTQVAVATSTGSGTGTTFTSGSNVESAHGIDSSDTVSCTYRLQFQDFAPDISEDYAVALLETIVGGGALTNITPNKFWLTNSGGGMIKSGSLNDNGLTVSVGGAAGSETYTVIGTVNFWTVPTEPTHFKVFTSAGGTDGQTGLIIFKSLTGEPPHAGDQNDVRLSSFDPNDDIVLPIHITLNRLTSTPVE